MSSTIQPLNLNQSTQESQEASASPFADMHIFSSATSKEKEIFVPEIVKLKSDGVQNTFDIIIQQKQGQLTFEQANAKIKTLNNTISLLPDVIEGLLIFSKINGVRLETKLFSSSFISPDLSSLTISAAYLLNPETLRVDAVNPGLESFVPVYNNELANKITPYKEGFPFKINQSILDLTFIPELKPIAEAEAIVASNQDFTKAIVGDKAFVYSKKLFKLPKLKALATLMNNNSAAIENFFLHNQDSILNKLVAFIKANGALTKENLSNLKQDLSSSISEFNKLIAESVNAFTGEIQIKTGRTPEPKKLPYATIDIKK